MPSMTAPAMRSLALLERAPDAIVLARHPLGVDEQREPLVERHRDGIGVLLLLFPRRCHRAQTKRVELFEGRFFQHLVTSFSLFNLQ
jgi:hypothetical protein